MKKLIFFGAISAAVLFTATFVACNSTEEPMIEETSSTSIYSSTDFGLFMASVDSLNNAYTEMSRGVVTDDGGNPTPAGGERWGKREVVTYADQAGSLVGGTLGAIGGAAAGASAGGLASVGLGYLGSRFGEIVYSHLYSSIAKLVTGYQVVNYGSNVSVTHHATSKEYAYLDSVGIRHNILMRKMARYDRKYMNMSLDNQALLNEFYSDFMKELNSVYPEVGGFVISAKEKAQILESCSSILAIGKKHLDKKDGKKLFVNEVSDLMIHKYNIPSKKVMIFKNFSVSISNQMDQIDESQIERYTGDLDKVIQNSSFEDDEKASVVNMGQISINSNICWKN